MVGNVSAFSSPAAFTPRAKGYGLNGPYRWEEDEMRRLLTAIAVALGSLLVPTPALADAPIIEPVPGEDFVIPAGEVCEFGISVHFLVNREKSITFLDDEGNFERQLVTGALVYELTNLSTDGSLVFNIPGPGRFTPNPDGSLTLVATGPWVLFDPFGTHIFNAGRAVVIGTVDPTTGILRLDIQNIVGHSFDICEALAAA